MAALGAAKTGKFAIGTAELRVGPLTEAGRLTGLHSVGLIDTATFSVDQTSVDLLGGFPQVIMDTQVTNQSAQVTATLREFSRRNLGIMLGQGLVYAASEDNVADKMSGIKTASGVTVTVESATGFVPDSAWTGWAVIYRPDNAGESFIVKVSGADTGTNTITLDTSFPVPTAVPVDGVNQTWNIARLASIPIGNVSSVNYFTVQMIVLDRQTGRPKITNFWKAAIGSGMTMSNNATDFASSEMTLKVLRPTLADYDQSTSPLYHLKNIIGDYPMGMSGEMSDNPPDTLRDTTTTTTTTTTP